MMKMISLRGVFVAAALLVASILPASAQTTPNWTYGYVPTTAQWNALWASKQDYLGAPPLLVTGGTMTGPLITAPSSATVAGINIPPGAAPTSPANGDLWTTSSGIFAQINGATINLTGATSTSFAGTSPITVSFPSGIVTYACSTCGVTGSPLSQFAATTSAQLRGVLSDETGTGVAVFQNGALGTPTATSIALGGATIGSNALAITGTFAFSAGGTFGGALSGITTLASGAHAITSSSAAAITVGLNGATNPAFNVDASTALSATGINIKSAAAGGQVALSVISSGTNETLSINAKGSGSINIANISTANTDIGTGGGGLIVHNSLTASGTITLNLGSDATGDIYYRNSGGTISRLPIGGNGNILNVAGTIPAWAAPTGGGNVSNVATPVSGQVALWTGATSIQGANFATFLTAGVGIAITGTTTATVSTTNTPVLLNTITASGSTTTMFDTTSLTAVYSFYEIVFEGITPAVGTNTLNFQIHSGGSFQTTGYLTNGFVNNGTNVISANPTTFIPLCNPAAQAAAGPGISGFIRIHAPSTSAIHSFVGLTTYNSAGPGMAPWTTSGFWNTAGAVDGFQIAFNSGNITSGVIKVYGYP